ncbi:ribonucleoside triphosphate reductase [Candidatus Pacearchaeota archaeon]|nr:ribonucleoside triphosphate reductase [Candidatus Pacearchaeota archaeon]
MVKKIRKRDGDVVLFQENKIEDAIWKAARAVGGQDKERSKQLALMVFAKLDETYGVAGTADIEFVQDSVEKILIEEGHAKVAKAFILYRQSHNELRNVKGLFDTIEVIEDYIGLDDWMVKENSNMGYSLQGLNNYIATKIVANYWMRRIYPEAIRKVHEAGDLHIHDLGTLGAYCVGWDLKDLLTVGFKGVKGKVESKPPKHLRTALGQMVNFFYTLQGETAGAQAFSNFDTLLAPFIRYDKLTYEQVKQTMQEFVFNLAVPTRVGFQTPFTNITMDLEIPSYMANEHVIIGGQPQMETYNDFTEEMKMINRAFAECMLEGDATGQVFTFPIPTYNITKDFDFNNPEYDLIWEMTAKYGIPYFSNFVNSDMKPEDSRSMCCRLRIDNTQLTKRGGGLFGANPQTGSIGVVTVNMARLGYLATSEDDFLARLDRLMELAKESLEIKRKTIENFTNIGLYPYTKFYLRQVHQRFGEYWKNHFATIGLLGMNEAIVNFMPGENIVTKRGKEFSIKVLDFMRDRLTGYQEETGNIYNLEATPGEGTTYRFARLDKKRFGRILVANETAYQNGAKPYYTNSSQLPVNFTEDVFEALDYQDELQCKYTGGTVFHTFIGEKMTKDSVKKMVDKISRNYHLPYFTLTPTFSICPIHGYIPGEHEYCPKCDDELEEAEQLAKNIPVLSVSDDVSQEVSDDEIAQEKGVGAEVEVKKAEPIAEPIVEKVVEEVALEVVRESKAALENPVDEIKSEKRVSAFGDNSAIVEEVSGVIPLDEQVVEEEEKEEPIVEKRVSDFESTSESMEESLLDDDLISSYNSVDFEVRSKFARPAEPEERTSFFKPSTSEDLEKVEDVSGIIPLSEQVVSSEDGEEGEAFVSEVSTTSESVSRFAKSIESVEVREELIADSAITERVSVFENPTEEPIAEPGISQDDYGVVPLEEQVADDENVQEKESPFGGIGVVNNASIDDSVERISAFENVNEKELEMNEPVTEPLVVVGEDTIEVVGCDDEYSEDEVGDYDSEEEDEEITSGDMYTNVEELNNGGDTYGENEM